MIHEKGIAIFKKNKKNLKMKNNNIMKIGFSLLIVCFCSMAVLGQKTIDTPLDGFYKKENVKTKQVLKYDHVREADVFWEKRIWRVIDVREKINKHFVYPNAPFVKIMLDAAKEGDITVYSAMDDQFKTPFSKVEAGSIGSYSDTIVVVDPVTFKETLEVVTNELNWNDIKRFRVKEVWYFDEESATMKVRILGIAPLKEVYDEQDNFRYEQPLFWAYFPELRQVLGNEEVINPFNDANPMSWEDVFEMRYFSSYISKESNVYDRRIQDYKSGMDIVLESKKIEDSLFDFERDLWSK